MALSVAERALGVAALHLRDLNAAIRHLRAAVALGERVRSLDLAVDARIRLAGTLNVCGRARQALREIDDVLLLDLDGLRRARAAAQRGAILSQLGRHDEALGSYQSAVPGLRRARDYLWLQRVLSNRGVLHGYRHEFVAAEADLRETERLCRMLDLELSIGFVHQNLGWVAGIRGDVPLALDYFHRAEQCFSNLGSELGELLTDRSQLLLSAFLVSEAREAAEQAVQHFERDGRQIMLPEVRLLLAQAAALDGHPTLAIDQARRAVREFLRQQRAEWATLGRFVVLRLRLAGSARPREAVGQLVSLAEALAAAHWPTAALEARVLAGRLALERGRDAEGRRQLELASRGRRSGQATLRARAWHAEALLRVSRGNCRGARIALRHGLKVLDDHRATFGATDLRAHASGHRVELAELGLAMAVTDGRPELVLQWAEEGRASHLLLRPVRPPDDPTLARDLAELRATVGEIDASRSAGRVPAKLVARQLELERKVRDHCRRQRSDPAAPSHSLVLLPSLSAALQDAALIEFLSVRSTLFAVSVVEGHAELRELGSLANIGDLVQRIPFALHRLTRHRVSAASRTAAVALLRHVAEQLDEVLLRPISAQTCERPLVLVPTGPLQSLPWSILPSCRGRPITVAPSAALWHAAHRVPSTGSGTAVAAGPDLHGACAEAEAVAALHGCRAQVGAAATVDAVMDSLKGVRLAHLAAHGQVHAHNPLFSSIQLADGPLTVYDLEQLGTAPQLVVLSACNSGRANICAGDELLGLTTAFLSRNAQQIVASVMPIPDAETTPLMIAFHELLTSGQTVASALAQAQARVSDGDDAAVAAAAGFVCIGADGTLVPRISPEVPRQA